MVSMDINETKGCNVQEKPCCTLSIITGFSVVHLMYTSKTLKQPKIGHLRPLFEVY